MKNKALTITLVTLVALVLVGIVIVVLLMQMNKGGEKAEPTIDEILEQSVDIEEITTNLADHNFIRIELKIQTDNKKAAEELEKRDFQVRNIVIQELSEMTSEDFEGKAGKKAFEDSIRSQINPLMQEGEVTEVYIVSYVIQ